MEINELRIGNWVKEHDPINGTNIYSVYHIADYGNISRVSLEGKGQLASCTVKDIEPIELTGDILIKTGCFKRSYNEIYSMALCADCYDYYISYQNVKDNKHSFVAHGYKNYLLTRKIILDNIQYLHELQNVFFSFTNQELEIKL
jgi:hypothetical protein